MKYILIVLLLLTSQLKAADYFMLTDIGSSAEQISRGHIEGFSESSASVFENPAGLFRVNHSSITGFSTNLMNEIFYTNLALAANTRFGTIGVGYMGAKAFGLPHTGENEQREFYTKYHYDYNDYLVKLSYQFLVDPSLSVGMNYSFYSKSLWTVSGKGSDFDLGFIWNPGVVEVSGVLKNITGVSHVEFTNDGAELLAPRTILGLKYPLYDFNFYLQYQTEKDQGLLSQAISYKPFNNPFLSLSVGRREYNAGASKRSNIAMGLNLSLNNIHFSYAREMSEFYSIDNNHYFSIAIND